MLLSYILEYKNASRVKVKKNMCIVAILKVIEILFNYNINVTE